MKKWFKDHKSSLIKILILLAILIIISGICLLIMYFSNILVFDNGIAFNIDLFREMKNEWWFYLVWLAIQIITTTLLSFVPGTSMTFIIASVALFGANWQTFLLCFGGVILSSIAMDLLGRFGGSKLVMKLIGEKEYHSAYELVQTKGITYIPVMYLLPIFPDDAICMITGTMKFKFWLHCIYIVLCRGIGCATIVFGLNLIPYQEFTTFYEWFVLGGVLIAYVTLLLKIANHIDKKITKYIANRKEK